MYKAAAPSQRLSVGCAESGTREGLCPLLQVALSKLEQPVNSF